MSFGRSLMNGVTLGLWGWLTDPDITEFYDEVAGTYRYDADGDGLVLARDFIKKFNGKPSKHEPSVGTFTSMKDVEKAMAHFHDEYKAKYHRRDLRIIMEAPVQAYMMGKSGTSRAPFTRDDWSTHCKDCGKLLSWGKRVKATATKCREHPRAGKFLCAPKEAPKHRWYFMEGSFYGGLRAYESGYGLSIDIDYVDEDYED